MAELKRNLSDVLTARKTLSDHLDQQKRACLDRLHSAKVFTTTSKVFRCIYVYTFSESLCMLSGNVCLQEAHKTLLVTHEQVRGRIEELRLKCEEYRKESSVMEDAVTDVPRVLEELQ